MPQPDASAARSASLFWKIWEKTWWLIGLLFVGANAWGASRYGWAVVLRCWAAGFAILGLAILLYGRRARRRATESLSWLPVEARILRSELVREVQRSHSSEPGSIQYMTYWYPEIEYEYEVQGRSYISNRVLLVRVNFPEPKAREMVARYPAGARVQAWCDPRRPASAVLERGLAGYESQYRIPLIVGAAFLLLGLAGLAVLGPLAG